MGMVAPRGPVDTRSPQPPQSLVKQSRVNHSLRGVSNNFFVDAHFFPTFFEITEQIMNFSG